VFQDGADRPEPAERVSAETPQPVEVAVADLDDYPGTYELAPGFVFTVTRLGDRLTGQATGQPQFVLESRGSDVFEVPEVGARFTFLRGAGGRVERLELKQGGQTLVGGKR